MRFKVKNSELKKGNRRAWSSSSIWAARGVSGGYSGAVAWVLEVFWGAWSLGVWSLAPGPNPETY